MFFFFFNDTATTEIYTLSLHDALPIFFFPPNVSGWDDSAWLDTSRWRARWEIVNYAHRHVAVDPRSEEHTSELQSRQYLVCRLLLEKKKKYDYNNEHQYLRIYTCIYMS